MGHHQRLDRTLISSFTDMLAEKLVQDVIADNELNGMNSR